MKSGALALLTSIAFSGCHDPCGNHAFSEFSSPSGKWKVVLFGRSCGATTGFTTQVSLLPADAGPPSGPGNLLSIDDDHGRVPLGRDNRVEVRVKFIGDSELSLAYPAMARAFREVNLLDGVAVRYERRR